ncbi:DNA-packaging protein FI [Citrobacter amalonaticus]|uniref:DNA-packaging protein FI n=1 Tax=Citrobacter amalonaticus TaxID=35703 RepID=UPI0020BFBA4B|nr:DNA-packaging protein FI [Citrobacter amalonaticus]MCK8152430.1 DNA-packaging protein FI [Citrobacter amalonaticus]HED3078687.1 DNA-packaging protein [Citrobacter amalonaticus]HEM7973624.1 DNA-packaging protein [Citrobacter farmeri]
MTAKEKLVERLKALGAQLERDVNVTGTIEELTMRVAELEEELDDGNDDEQSGDNWINAQENATDNPDDDQVQEKPAVTDAGLVTVITRATLHIDALHETENTPVAIAVTGMSIRVLPHEAEALIAGGLASEK